MILPSARATCGICRKRSRKSSPKWSPVRPVPSPSSALRRLVTGLQRQLDDEGCRPWLRPEAQAAPHLTDPRAHAAYAAIRPPARTRLESVMRRAAAHLDGQDGRRSRARQRQPDMRDALLLPEIRQLGLNQAKESGLDLARQATEIRRQIERQV